MKHEGLDGGPTQPLSLHLMSKGPQFAVGQAIIWISERSKSGEARFQVRGRVVKHTRKRVTIRVCLGDRSVCLRSVAPKYLIPDT